ncbi:transposase [Comamonas endophytica]|uniref:Transposase n=1 Tax=Comamonas endophytica TaxID=2949090 RepID=A0ABY6GCB8_9BURK|nr:MULTISPECIES: transposase [unclassified Acidovorax]MCD2512942.1 transposase [Acidovorax sp. D4N7]UYG52715.1 transposase [Acidovorax sp. 5MLIR]
MARLPRLTLASLPHHIIQRGNNGAEIFADAADCTQMLDLLREMARRFGVDIHAYVLLPSEFQLLATPETDTALPQFMQSVGRSYVRYFNNRHGRSGTLWNGRYRATVIDPGYLLTSMVALDWSPVRAGLVREPADYAWSSYAHNAGLRYTTLVHAHASFWALGNTPFAREAGYKAAVEAGISSEQLESIEQAALRGWALGSPQFVAELQNRTQRRVVRQRAGRPPKVVSNPSA